MKVAITAQGQTLDDAVDPRFGRAKHFLIVDTESEETTAVDNAQNLNAPQGAGIQAAQTVAQSGVEAVLTGHCGPKAFRTLQAAKIAIYTGATGTARETLAAFQAGTLSAANAPDVQGHW